MKREFAFLTEIPGVRGRFALLVALMLFSALTEGFGLMLLVPVLAALDGHNADGGRVAELIGALGLPLTLGPLLALFTALAILRAALIHGRSLAAIRLEITLVDGLRRRAWHALLHCDWRMLATMRQSGNASLLITTADRIGYAANQGMAVLASCVTLAGIGTAALAIAPQVTLAALACGALALFVHRRMRRRAARLGDRLDATNAAAHAALHEALHGLRIIKSYGREDRSEEDIAATFAKVREVQLAYQRDSGSSQAVLQGGGALLLALLVWAAMTRWSASTATVIPLVALFARALPLLMALQSAWQNWAHVRPAIKTAQELIAVTEAARECTSPAGNAPALKHAIRLETVGVKHKGRATPALDAIDLTIPARQVTVLVGPSGAGKSTLADLIGGLTSPDEGRITIDGTVLESGLRRCWRRRVAYVQQEPMLFTGTIRSNLLWADPTASDARLHDALRRAAAGFVETLPSGIDTDIGEAARYLSGGERQRIALARALLRDPDLLILDEPTSALDIAHEAAIAEALERLSGQITIVIISHKGAMNRLAHQIVTLEAGRVTGIEKRSAAELLGS